MFGKLVEGHDVLEKIENCGDEEEKFVKIIKCGENQDDTQTLGMSKCGWQVFLYVVCYCS